MAAATTASAETATSAPAPRRRRRRSVEGKPRLAVAFTVLFFLLLYVPIIVVVIFSFNSRKSLSSFDSFSLRWYDQFFHDEQAPLSSLRASIYISTVAMIGSLILGTMLAFALEKIRSRKARVVGTVTLVPLVTPEIVTGVAALLFFTGLAIKVSLTTVILAEITFSISYVAVIVRGRLAAMSDEVEEAARDLGCTPFQALRLVTVPMILPALIASGLLVFALVFDDFVLAFFVTGVDPQPLPVRIYSEIRLTISPAINAVGTCMMLVSVAVIGLSLLIPRLFGRKDNGLDLLAGG